MGEDGERRRVERADAAAEERRLKDEGEGVFGELFARTIPEVRSALAGAAGLNCFRAIDYAASPLPRSDVERRVCAAAHFLAVGMW